MGFLESRNEDHGDADNTEKTDANFSQNINKFMRTHKNRNDIDNNYQFSNNGKIQKFEIINENNSIDLEIQKISNIDIQNDKIEIDITKNVKSTRKMNLTIPVTIFLNGCLLGM
jgi:hypothetical protein